MSPIAEQLLDYLSRTQISARHLMDLWSQTPGVAISVIGDPIIDVYTYLRCIGLSKDFPTVNWEITEEHKCLGGCLKVAGDCAEQDAMVEVGVHRDILLEFRPDKIPETLIFTTDENAPNFWIEKRRFFTGNHILFRTTNDLAQFSCYPASIAPCQVLILSLFGLHDPISPDRLVKMANGALILVDTQNPAYLNRYGIDQVIAFATKEELAAAGLTGERDFKELFLKDGRHGSYVGTHHVPAFCMDPVDTLGSGDAYLATAAVMLAKYRERYHEAAILGSIAAAIHCSRFGNHLISREDIDAILLEAIDGQTKR